MLRHGARARVVCSHCFGHAPVVLLEERPKQAGAREDVLLRVERVPHSEVGRRARHQLHDAPGAFRRHRVRAKGRLGSRDGAHERHRQGESPSGVGHDLFDAAGNGLAAGVFQPVTFFGVAFAGAFDATGATPTVSAADGTLTADLSAFTAYYGGGTFNQGAPKPDGTGDAAVGSIGDDGSFVLEWTSLIAGGSFDGFTGVWHLEGTFSAG